MHKQIGRAAATEHQVDRAQYVVWQEAQEEEDESDDDG